MMMMMNPEKKLKSHERNCISIDRFGDQGGYFDVVVKPMLQQGHEGELCGWLREMSLLRTFVACPQEECSGRNLIWRPARVIDKYKWICADCKAVQSIRDNSFFITIKCELKICLQVILAWCQQELSEIAAANLGIKEHVVKKVYERCDKVVESYVQKHPEEWILGGPGSIIIVDEFPGGYMTENIFDNTNNRKRNNNSHSILCIAETNLSFGIPVVQPRIWLHMIKANPVPTKMDENDTFTKSKCGMVEEALSEIVKHVARGSYIVANGRARCCNYESVKELNQYHVISVEYLQKFDTNGLKLTSSLETIWQTGIEICEEVQDATRSVGKNIIANYLWRQRFGISPFQTILNHIAECYKFT